MEEGVLLYREILCLYETSAEAIAGETVLIRHHGDNPLCRNQGTPQINRNRELAKRRNETVPNVEPSQIFPVIVPNIPSNGPKNGTQNHQVTLIEPSASKSMSLQGKGRQIGPPGQEVYSEGFERFWRAFPTVRKGSKADAYKAWVKLKLEEHTAFIVQDVESKVESHQKWKDGFAPMATTYLNKSGWTEPLETTGSNGHAKETPFERTQRLQRESREDLTDEWNRGVQDFGF